MNKPLRTSDIAVDTGVHPNTVRLYETWGFLPPIPRNASGCRLLTEQHLQQMRLARLPFLPPDVSNWPIGLMMICAGLIRKRLVMLSI